MFTDHLRMFLGISLIKSRICALNLWLNLIRVREFPPHFRWRNYKTLLLSFLKSGCKLPWKQRLDFDVVFVGRKYREENKSSIRVLIFIYGWRVRTEQTGRRGQVVAGAKEWAGHLPSIFSNTSNRRVPLEVCCEFESEWDFNEQESH